MAAEFEIFSNDPEARVYFVKFVGGAAAVTKLKGKNNNVTVTYVSAGVVDITFPKDSGTFLGLIGTPSFQATAPAGVKGYTCEHGVFDDTTRKLRLNINNAAQALTDLAALQWLSVMAYFTADGSLQ